MSPPDAARGGASGPPLEIAMLVGRFPVVTETFLLNEVRALREAGARVEIVACSGGVLSPAGDSGGSRPGARPARAVSMGTTAGALLGCLLRSPVRSASALGLAMAAAGPNPRRGLRALRALLLACRMCDPVRAGGFGLIHAQFINRPALVAALLSRLTGIPCSISAHARDIFVPDLRLAPLVRAARFVVVCSTIAHRHLLTQVPPDLHSRIRCLHHGLDLKQFVLRTPGSRRPLDGGQETAGLHARRIQVLTVARLVPKKGVDTVLGALDILERRGWSVHLRLVGDGPERDSLLRLAESAGVKLEHVTGATPEEIHRWMCEADVLAMGCTTAKDGDRDGLPNAVLEAMASGLPVVTSAGGGVADAVEHGRTGLLVPPGDAEALARAMEEVVTHEELRRHIVGQARSRVESRFDIRNNVQELLTLLREASRNACHPSA